VKAVEFYSSAKSSLPMC